MQRSYNPYPPHRTVSYKASVSPPPSPPPAAPGTHRPSPERHAAAPPPFPLPRARDIYVPADVQHLYDTNTVGMRTCTLISNYEGGVAQRQSRAFGSAVLRCFRVAERRRAGECKGCFERVVHVSMPWHMAWKVIGRAPYAPSSLLFQSWLQ
ncbi:hypothetical protein SVAN01_02806 [Stagonosporopsis vannaccii]|nr:hypothetical protein SVAN01_02806 [Stagonosporopsis vannaccii]